MRAATCNLSLSLSLDDRRVNDQVIFMWILIISKISLKENWCLEFIEKNNNYGVIIIMFNFIILIKKKFVVFE